MPAVASGEYALVTRPVDGRRRSLKLRAVLDPRAEVTRARLEEQVATAIVAPDLPTRGDRAIDRADELARPLGPVRPRTAPACARGPTPGRPGAPAAEPRVGRTDGSPRLGRATHRPPRVVDVASRPALTPPRRRRHRDLLAEALRPAPASVPVAPPAPGAPPGAPPPTAPVGTRPAGAGRYDRSIIEGPLRRAVWKLAWPAMLTNIVGGLQGIVDHALVGHLVGFAGNAAIGAAWQIFLVVIAFISSLFAGMGVLVARLAGAGDADAVDRTAYQAFLTAMGISLGIMAPLGYLLAPSLLDLVNAAPAVREQALPFLRVMFLGGSGMLVYFMLGGALRAAGDARTPMVLGIAMTVLNLGFNLVLIRGLGPIPAFGTAGSAMGTVLASGLVAAYAMVRLWGGGWVVRFPRGARLAPDWGIIAALFRFGLPAGIQGIAMNVGGVLMLAVIGSLAESAAAQAAFAVSYSQLFSLITWTSVGLMGAAATVAGQNLGAGQPERAEGGVRAAARFGLVGAAVLGTVFFTAPRLLLAVFGMDEPAVIEIGAQLLRVLGVSGLFITVALAYTGGLQGTGDTKSPLYISIVSQVAVPLGICWLVRLLGTLEPLDVWLAILAGHVTRCALSVWRFEQGKWRHIVVDIDGRTSRARPRAAPTADAPARLTPPAGDV